MDKEEYGNMNHDMFDSDPSDGEYQVQLPNEGNNTETETKLEEKPSFISAGSQKLTTVTCLESLKSMTAEAFASQFQDVIIRALMQSSVPLLSPSSSSGSPCTGGMQPLPLVIKEDSPPPTNWNESLYNMTSTQRKRRPPMTRTSAGEESDSQDDFLIPENESPQQKSLWTRRLNRYRVKKAKDLTNNRRAFKKLPYVLHIDGTGKAKGIHRHLWRAAIRGQCVQLDPTMDNINHHPQHVVDSIYFGLEKQWEFEGFAHRARELFEKSATKYMRNQKMQLKTKFKKSVGEARPTDVNDSQWSKIKKLTKDSTKVAVLTGSVETKAWCPEGITEVFKDQTNRPLHLHEVEVDTVCRSQHSRPSEYESVVAGEESMEERISILRSELLRLENSKKSTDALAAETGKGKAIWNEKMVSVRDLDRGPYLKAQSDGKDGPHLFPSGSKQSSATLGRHSPSAMKVITAIAGRGQGQHYLGSEEPDCGDLVSLLVLKDENQEEIGKAIVMALSGSKYIRKNIPKGWSLVKVYTYTEEGGTELCPIPVGWANEVKYKELKDAEGKNIVWPESLMCL